MTQIVGTFSVDLGSLEDLVRDGSGRVVRDADGKPFFSLTADRMQYRNHLTLSRILYGSGVKPPPGALVDMGCGRGRLEACLRELIFENENIGVRDVVLVDMDKPSLDIANTVTGYMKEYYKIPTPRWQRGIKFEYKVADPIKLEEINTEYFTVADKKEQWPEIAFLLCSSVFHWVPLDQRENVLGKFYDLLVEGGVLAMCISATGTAEDFLEAYRTIIENFGVRNRITNPEGYKRAEYMRNNKDPIGSVNHTEIRHMIQDEGFQLVADPLVLDEAELYDSPREYAESVAIYGRSRFLKCIGHSPPDWQDMIWDEIVKEHTRIAKRNGWRPGNKYKYTQTNVYFVGQAIGAKDTTRAKSFVTKTLDDEVSLYDIEAILHPSQMKFGETGLRTPSGRSISPTLVGNTMQIKGRKTTVDIMEILSEVLTYSAKDWVSSIAPTQSCDIGYSITQDQLGLSLKVETRHSADYNKALNLETIQTLQRQGVTISTSRDGRKQVYQFKIPLIQSAT